MFHVDPAKNLEALGAYILDLEEEFRMTNDVSCRDFIQQELADAYQKLNSLTTNDPNNADQQLPQEGEAVHPVANQAA